MTQHMKRSGGRTVKAISAEPGEILHVGVDVHRKSYSVAVWSDQREHVAHWTQPASPAGLVEKLMPIAEHIAHVVYEAGPTGYTLVRAWPAPQILIQLL